MRFSPWLPVLLLLALAAYLIPGAQPTFRLDEAPQAEQAVPDTLGARTRELFAQVRPAVVRVETMNPDRQEAGIGTGFFISAQGQVLTAYHVVSTGRLFQISTLDGRSYPVRVTAFDAAADVALLETVRGGPFPYLPLAPSAPRVGQGVLAVGNSGGDFLQPRQGQLLRLSAEAGRADFPQGTLEMTAPLAPGDSGGPILDTAGQAIGVVSYIRVDMSGQTRRSYAVPVVEGGPLVTSLRAGEKRDVPVVGLILDPVHSGVTDPPGAVIARIARGSPAEASGLRASLYDEQDNLRDLRDVIISVNGQRVEDADQFITAVRGAQVGETITLGYVRDDVVRETRITLVARASVPDLDE